MFARDAQPQTPVTAPTDRCSFHQRETRLEDPKPPRLRGFPGARSQLVLVGLLVAHRGFEPLISALRGRCPRPLDECALTFEDSILAPERQRNLSSSAAPVAVR